VSLARTSKRSPVPSRSTVAFTPARPSLILRAMSVSVSPATTLTFTAAAVPGVKVVPLQPQSWMVSVPLPTAVPEGIVADAVVCARASAWTSTDMEVGVVPAWALMPTASEVVVPRTPVQADAWVSLLAASPRAETMPLMVPKTDNLLWKEAACCCSGTKGCRSSATSLDTMPWMSMPLARPGEVMAMVCLPVEDDPSARRSCAGVIPQARKRQGDQSRCRRREGRAAPDRATLGSVAYRSSDSTPCGI